MKQENYYRGERWYGKFERSLPLPMPVQADKVTAKYRDGVRAADVVITMGAGSIGAVPSQVIELLGQVIPNAAARGGITAASFAGIPITYRDIDFPANASSRVTFSIWKRSRLKSMRIMRQPEARRYPPASPPRQ